MELDNPELNEDAIVGQVITPRHRAIHRIGGSDFGDVYLAEDVTSGDMVAVKILHHHLPATPELLKRVLWDARLALATRPSAIVRVHQVDRLDDGRVFIAMEHLVGRNLADLVRRDGPIEIGRALRLAVQCAEALAAASNIGVRHGNLKPENVVVMPSDDEVKLTDFGVAWLRDRAGRRASGEDRPTTRWFGDIDDGEWADIRALGAILYVMLTGVAPVAERPPDAAPANPSADRPIPVSQRRPEVPADVEQFVMETMKGDSARRSGWKGHLERLRRLAAPYMGEAPAADTVREDPVELSTPALASETLGVAARPDGRRWRSLSPRGKTLVLGGVAVVVVVALVTLSSPQWRRDRGAPPTPENTTTSVPEPPAVSPEPAGTRSDARAQAPVEQRAADEAMSTAAAEEGRQAAAEAAARAAEEAARQAATEAAARAAEERRRQAAEAAARVAEQQRRQAAEDAARVAEQQRRQAAEDAARVAEPQRRQAAEAAARVAEQQRRQAAAEAARLAAEEPSRPATVRAPRPAEEPREPDIRGTPMGFRNLFDRLSADDPNRARDVAASPRSGSGVPTGAGPVQPGGMLAASDLARIRTDAEAKLLKRGLYRVSSADRWGVTLEISPHGEATLSGVLRDRALLDEAIRLVREIRGVQAVRARVSVGAAGTSTEAHDPSTGLPARAPAGP